MSDHDNPDEEVLAEFTEAWRQALLHEMAPGGGCPTEGCKGDQRYAAPGRGHNHDCIYPWESGWREDGAL